MQLALECEERVCVGRGSETALTLGIHVPPGPMRGSVRGCRGECVSSGFDNHG